MVQITEISTTRLRAPRQRKARRQQLVVALPRRGKRKNRRAKRSRNAGMPRSLTGDGAKYLRCLFGGERGAAKIPDGDTKHSVAIEFVTTQALNPSPSGQLVVMCAPGLPGSLRIASGAGTLKSGGGVGTAFSTVGATGISIPYQDMLTNPGSINFKFAQNTNVMSARVVKYDLEVTQIGPTLNQQGVAVTARVPSMFQTKAILPQYIDYTAANSLYAGHTFPALKGLVLAQPCSSYTPATLGFDTVSAYPSSKVCSATVPCYMVGKGCGDWVPSKLGAGGYVDSTNNGEADGVLVFSRVSLAGSTSGAWGGTNSALCFPIYPYAPEPTDQVLAGDSWNDPECEMLIWAGNNFDPTNTFQVRTTVCMELEISYVNSVYRSLVTPPATIDHLAIDTADRAMAVMPPSVSKSEGSNGWWSSITSGVTGIAEIIGDLGLPYVSPIAAVTSRMAKMLGF